MLIKPQTMLFAKTYLPDDKTRHNLINKAPLPEYFDGLMRRRHAITAKNVQARMDHKRKGGVDQQKPLNEMGYLNLPKANFANMIKKAQTGEDIETLKDAYFNFLGHRNIIPQTTLDKLMMKGLEVEEPEKLFDFIKYHSQLLYHPKAMVI